MEHVASIALDGVDGRGKVCIEEVPDTYYDEGGTMWRIIVERPDGTIEEPAIAPDRTREEALESIDLTWGSGAWDLIWND